MAENQIDRPRDPMKEFQAKLSAKLRDDIAGMLPADFLGDMARPAVEELFFKKREGNAGYGRVEPLPPYFVEEVGRHARPLIDRMIVEFISAGDEQIKRAIAEYISDKN